MIPQARSSAIIVCFLTNSLQIEASQPRTIAPAVGEGGATGKPSLRVTLRLPPSTLSEVIEKPSLWLKLPLPHSTSSQNPPSSSLPFQSVLSIKVEDTSEVEAGPASRNPGKRTAPPADDDDSFDLFAPSSSHEPAPKRQRGKASVRKPRAAPKAKAAVKVEEDGRPEPRGRPEVWAEVYRAYYTIIACTCMINILPGSPTVVRIVTV